MVFHSPNDLFTPLDLTPTRLPRQREIERAEVQGGIGKTGSSSEATDKGASNPMHLFFCSLPVPTALIPTALREGAQP